MSMVRAFIDQPSSLQTLHHMHGTNVIVDTKSIEGNGGSTVTVALLQGDVITMVVPLNAISFGWRKK